MGDTDPPVVSSLDPIDGATDVSEVKTFVASFNEDIAVLSGGTIYLTNQTASSVTTIAATDSSQVSVSGNLLTINPMQSTDVALQTSLSSSLPSSGQTSTGVQCYHVQNSSGKRGRES